ncbi:receptor-activated Ca2+-permeable cation channel [Penicillium brasilianum]|uniref:Receptor-activated Ca2+-permeable cation channel n=1 Tax=Penicillium brasilianum TaxID=104259 RepID=A0A1S9RXH8_PENBI|nr:receptor-activated Ca2+-permeable cation channel [Penicillium brasilianum]
MDRYSDTLLDDETIDEDGPLNIGESDDPYTSEQLRDPQMNLRIVRPLVDQLYDSEDVSTVYCLIVNRAQFLREQHYQGHLQTVNITRATLCEILASRVLRRFDEDNSGPAGLLLLANILVAGFEPFQNAPETITRTRPNAPQWPVQKRGGYERKITALEVAIISESKTLLSSSACQKVVDAVYRGQIIYTPLSFVDIIPDHYKHHPISLYNPRKSPILNHRRLIVPRLRNIIEICQFAVLLLLYGLTMVYRDGTNITTYETIFCTYASGWLLEEFAAIIEHGWYVHTQNVWSFLDIAFFGIYSVYFMLRTYAAVVEDVDLATSALDILCVAAPVLLPRLAFNLMPDNMLFISLRAMMRDFSVLTLLATWCFAGFFLSMKWLIESRSEIVIDLPGSATISKWMLWIWFGLDGTGFERSPDFHVLLGPALMIAFAFLGNTLFLTVLVSMLTNTFAKIVENATAEVHFRRAVLTFEGVKSDAIFAYRPPLNILALVILLPLKFVLSPRWFHKVNVGAARVLNAPLLLAIGLYERHQLWQAPKNGTKKLYKRTSLLPWTFSGFSPHGDIQAVFDIEPPKNVFS